MTRFDMIYNYVDDIIMVIASISGLHVVFCFCPNHWQSNLLSCFVFYILLLLCNPVWKCNWSPFLHIDRQMQIHSWWTEFPITYFWRLSAFVHCHNTEPHHIQHCYFVHAALPLLQLPFVTPRAKTKRLFFSCSGQPMDPLQGGQKWPKGD